MDERIRKRLAAAQRVSAACQMRVQLAEGQLAASRKSATELEEKAARLMAMLDPGSPLAGGAFGEQVARRIRLASNAAGLARRNVAHCEAALLKAKVRRAAADRACLKRASEHRRALESEELVDILEAAASSKLPAMLQP